MTFEHLLTELTHYAAGEQSSEQGKSQNVSIGLGVQELDSAVDILKSRGVQFQPITEEKAARLAHFSDPEGDPLYLIELE